MIIHSVIIKLIRNGAGVGPDYSITIYGHGTIVYEGKENVKVKDVVEEAISEGKIMALLNEFKNSGFFSLNDNFSAAGVTDRPYTTISISIPSDTGKMIEKKITHYHNDRTVPETLKNLEEKIDDIVQTQRWIGETYDAQIFKQKTQEPEIPVPKIPKITKPPQKNSKKNTKPLLAICMIALIVVIIIFLVINLGIIDISSDTSPPSKIYNPEITTIATASNILDYEDFTPLESFEKGDTVNIYFEYTDIKNIDSEGSCDVLIELKVKLDQLEVFSGSYSIKKFESYSKYSFETDETWSTGLYTVELKLKDNNTNKINTKESSFTLTEVSFKIETLEPVEELYTDGKFDIKLEFNQGDILKIYQVYEGFEVDEHNKCDLEFTLDIKLDGSTVLTLNASETNPLNNSRLWWLDLNDYYLEDGFYYAYSYLTDNFTSEIVKDITFFIINE